MGTNLYTYMNKDVIPKKEGRCFKECPNGYFPDTNLCKMCDESCTVCSQLNFCLNCTMNYVTRKLYHFVNF